MYVALVLMPYALVYGISANGTCIRTCLRACKTGRHYTEQSRKGGACLPFSMAWPGMLPCMGLAVSLQDIIIFQVLSLWCIWSIMVASTHFHSFSSEWLGWESKNLTLLNQNCEKVEKKHTSPRFYVPLGGFFKLANPFGKMRRGSSSTLTPFLCSFLRSSAMWQGVQENKERAFHVPRSLLFHVWVHLCKCIIPLSYCFSMICIIVVWSCSPEHILYLLAV